MECKRPFFTNELKLEMQYRSLFFVFFSIWKLKSEKHSTDFIICGYYYCYYSVPALPRNNHVT